jgi:putative intracellular protease/amidase
MTATATPSTPTPRSDVRPVLIVLTSHGQKGSTGQATGYYLSEVTHPLAVLHEAGLVVEFASILGGEPPVDGLDLNDAVNARYWADEGFRQAVRTTPPLADVDPGRYRAVLFAGGHGTVWDFPDSPAVQTLTRAVYEQGGVVAAVCHGPSALVNVRLTGGAYLVSGKRVAAFTDAEEQAVGLTEVVPFLLASTLQLRGALHQAAPNWAEQVVVDGRLVTGQNPQSAHGVGLALRSLLV